MPGAEDRGLDGYRFCALPQGFYVYPGRRADRVIFRCRENGPALELKPVEALILAARLAFVARERLARETSESPGEHRLSVVRAEG